MLADDTSPPDAFAAGYRTLYSKKERKGNHLARIFKSLNTRKKLQVVLVEEYGKT